MENLALRMDTQIRSLILILLFMAVPVIMSLCTMRSRRKAVGRGRRRQYRRDRQWREARTVLIVMPVLALLLCAVTGFTLHEYRLDREEGPVQAAGVVTRAGYSGSSKSGKRYRIKLDDGTEKGLSLYIHKSLIDDYAIEEGAYYELTYYPRTKTLCGAEKQEKPQRSGD